VGTSPSRIEWLQPRRPVARARSCRALRPAAAGALLLALAAASCGGGGNGAAAVAPAPAATAAPTAAAPATPGAATVAPAAVPATSDALAITATEPKSYRWDVLGVGKTLHVDSADELTAVPGKYKGLKYLRTANADRFLSAGRAIAFEINKDVAILVAYDAQAAPHRPGWLASWTDTGDTLVSASGVYTLYRRSFARGLVALGGNELGFSSYAVVVDDGTALGNAAPAIVGNPARSVSANRTYEFLPTASDADGDRLAFSAVNLPPWLTLDPTTGRLSGTPTAAAIGTHADIVVSVSDGESTAALPAFALTVSAVGTNSPPTITALVVPTATQFMPYSYQPLATDPDADALVFTIVNRPRWAAFDPATGRLEGTPGAGDAGSDSNIIIHVSDGTATTSLPAFTIRVYAPGETDVGTPASTNGPPAIFGAPATTTLAGTPYVFAAAASDPDSDPLTYSIINRPAWASFDNAGILAGTPSPTDVGSYEDIVISVSDGVNVAALAPFTLVVRATNANVPPSISGTPSTSVSQGQSYSFTPAASDANGDTLIFSISGRPAWATFNPATGRLSGTPTTADAGTYGNIRVSVSDGELSASLAEFSIAVSAAPPNLPPSISGGAATQSLVGSHYSFTPLAIDPDGDALSFTVLNLPEWASFNPTTGRLSGTATAADVGTYDDIVIRVSDGQATSPLPAFAITIVPVATGTAMLSWTPPTANTDGSPLTNLAGYRVHWGTTRGSYAHSVTLNGAGLSSYVVDQLTPGTWYFVVTAVNALGVESSFSNEASKTIH
jgi:hypothetical protein